MKTQGVKQLYKGGLEARGRSTEEYLNEMMVGENGGDTLRETYEYKEQELVTPKRTGFVAVEWGGTEIK